MNATKTQNGTDGSKAPGSRWGSFIWQYSLRSSPFMIRLYLFSFLSGLAVPLCVFSRVLLLDMDHLVSVRLAFEPFFLVDLMMFWIPKWFLSSLLVPNCEPKQFIPDTYGCKRKRQACCSPTQTRVRMRGFSIHALTNDGPSLTQHVQPGTPTRPAEIKPTRASKHVPFGQVSNLTDQSKLPEISIQKLDSILTAVRNDTSLHRDGAGKSTLWGWFCGHAGQTKPQNNEDWRCLECWMYGFSWDRWDTQHYLKTSILLISGG